MSSKDKSSNGQSSNLTEEKVLTRAQKRKLEAESASKAPEGPEAKRPRQSDSDVDDVEVVCDLTRAQMHGFLAIRNGWDWESPSIAVKCYKSNRPDQGNETPSHEYLDSPKVLDAKMAAIADLVRRAKFCVAYTGAGLSKSAGIADYATKSKQTVVKGAPELKSSFLALPTVAHKVIAAMEQAGLVHHLVQQNHDGLPQKAGFPQEKINEIHGSWYDPSNRVVKFDEELRSDLCELLSETEKKVDLCFCLGTSLSGMTSDLMAITPAKKSVRKRPAALGTIVINLQRTHLDEKCAVRVWSKLDEAFAILARHLGLTIPSEPLREIPIPEGNSFQIPYDSLTGNLEKDGEGMIIHLSKGAQVKVVFPDAKNVGAIGVVLGKNPEGHHKIEFRENFRGRQVVTTRILGKWWIESALKGAVPYFPIVNFGKSLKKGSASSSSVKDKKEFDVASILDDG